ncbi:uncharacterized protein LOC104583609 [Brachypodium distachyon]|uniref:Uncharacterized protein n=1 Tax=Brachypodium distachyon TaxID=15368 RepID=A0A2K2CYN2_BRADI|nr:uncharacterized protein LOC104583609 [Brachypodium distachyon]PNT67140.1 hypothetical protein BRADI_3g21466v3 [Brachypodium distachyon]|eukprot:XP_010234611.1 uncharacterized protein LOC104583609 [Brachypodium distachyon]
MEEFNLNGSGVPSRVLCLEPGADRWTDVPVLALPHLQHAVARGCPDPRIHLAGDHWHVYDFPNKRRYVEDQPTTTSVPLAWFDEGGTPFFPPGLAAGVPVAASENCTVSEHQAVTIVSRWTMEMAAVNRAEISVPGEFAESIFREMERQMGINGVKLGWYGASAEDVRMASAGLFRSPNWELLGAHRAYGHGLHLSPLRFPHLR